MARTAIKNCNIEGAFEFGYPYTGMLKPGEIAIVSTDVATTITNLGGIDEVKGILDVYAVADTEAVTVHDGGGTPPGMVNLTSVQTITAGPKKFAAGTLEQMNGAGTFGHTFASAATANNTMTLPDASFTPSQSGSATAAGGAAATTATQPAFTGTPATSATASKFTGTGFVTAGQVVTTTDNQTMTLNQCAGMWLITATHAPCLIVSNTAVNGAPAVLTVMGLAPTTANEAYSILTAPTPAGSVATHTHTGPSHTHVQS